MIKYGHHDFQKIKYGHHDHIPAIVKAMFNIIVYTTQCECEPLFFTKFLHDIEISNMPQLLKWKSLCLTFPSSYSRPFLFLQETIEKYNAQQSPHLFLKNPASVYHKSAELYCCKVERWQWVKTSTSLSCLSHCSSVCLSQRLSQSNFSMPFCNSSACHFVQDVFRRIMWWFSP